MIYFDYASTSPLDPEIREAYTGLLERYFANNESLHPLGTEVNKLLEKSRSQTAALLNIRREEVIFTSGASEANSLAVKGYALARRHKGRHLITTAVEHSSVLNSFRQLEKEFGFAVTYLKVDKNGRIDPAELAGAIREDTTLVSVMGVNNEVGTIEPIDEVKRIIRSHPGIRLHVDCVQAVGKLPIDLDGIDFASFAAHKIAGLKGCGVLFRRQGTELLPLVSGGVQEYGLRGGTENALNYALFGRTLEKSLQGLEAHRLQAARLNRLLREQLAGIPGILINSPADASPYICSLSCLKLPSEVHLNALASEGFCVSAQSTCASNHVPHSYVLEAMGITGARLNGVIRVSFGPGLAEDDVIKLADAIKENLKRYGIH